MKRYSYFVLSLLLMLALFFIVSCGNEPESTDTETNIDTSTNSDTSTDTKVDTDDEEHPDTCTITFKSENGMPNRVFVVEYGEAIPMHSVPKNPEREGYSFVGWYSGNQPWYPAPLKSDVIVTARWLASNNTIVFDPNGGDGEMSMLTIPTDESKRLTSNRFERAGYKFTGWSLDPLGLPVYKDGAKYEMDATKLTTLYACWEAIKYDITYDIGPDAENRNPTQYTVKNTLTFSDPTRKGYDFTGWTYKGSPITSTEGITGNITLVAGWELERFEIIYNGVNEDEHTNPTSFNVEDSFDFTDPVKKGYTFNGWYYDKEYTKRATSLLVGTSEPQKIYASFSINKFPIEYKLENGVVNNKNNITEYDITTSFKFLDPSFERDGYEFAGWFIEGTNTPITELTPDTYIEPIVLVARLQLKQYHIIYANDLNITVNNVKTSYDVSSKKETFNIPNISKAGYTFEGWYSDFDYKNKVTQITIDPENPKDIIVYAKMTLCKYKITYNYGGKVGVNNPNAEEYDVLTHVTLQEATVGVYKTFAWYTDPDFKNKIESTQGRTGDITIYARWVSANNNPTMLLPEEKIEGIFQSGGSGKRKDFVYNLFDGDKVTSGIYNDGNDWYGEVGESLSIEFTEELEVYLVYAYVAGNWTHSTFTFYDASGKAVLAKDVEANASAEGTAEQVVVYDSTTPMKVKRLEIKVKDYKWNDPKTHKISEVEIFVTNPDYTPE